MNQIVIPQDQVIDMEALEMIVDGMSTYSGHKVYLEHQLVIKTDDPATFASLSQLLRHVPDQKAPDIKMPVLPSQRRSFASWNVVITGENITGQELTKRLNSHSFSPGTKLHHPKRGKLVVVRDQDYPDNPDRLVGVGEWKGTL